MKNILWFIVLALLISEAKAQIPANTRIQPVQVVTNTGVILFGTNSYPFVVITNTFAFSNVVSIGASGGLTNNGLMVISNSTQNGVATFNSNANFNGVGPVTFNTHYIVSNGWSRPSTNIALTSITNNNFPVSATTFIAVTNAAENIVFTGFSGGRDGQVLTVVNLIGTNMYFYDGSGLSTAGNRILLLGSATTLTNTGISCVEFIYSSVGTNWVLKSYVQ